MLFLVLDSFNKRVVMVHQVKVTRYCRVYLFNLAAFQFANKPGKAETLLYCALIAYIVFEGSEQDRNIITLVDLINGMEVKEDNDDFKNAVDYMFLGLVKRKPNCFAVRQYQKFKLASGVARRCRPVHFTM